MATLNAREIIRRRFKGSKNFFTPTVLEIEKISVNRAYEISSGEAFLTETKDGKVYGVTIVDYDPLTDTTKRSDDSQLCYSYQEARDYIEELKKESNLPNRSGSSSV